MQKCKTGKYPLSFEMWIFCNSQSDRDDDRRNFAAMTSTLVQRSLVSTAFASAAELFLQNHCSGYKL